MFIFLVYICILSWSPLYKLFGLSILILSCSLVDFIGDTLSMDSARFLLHFTFKKKGKERKEEKEKGKEEEKEKKGNPQLYGIMERDDTLSKYVSKITRKSKKAST